MKQMDEYYMCQTHILMKPLNSDYWMYFYNMALAFPLSLIDYLLGPQSCENKD